jgi:hypothetical protein
MAATTVSHQLLPSSGRRASRTRVENYSNPGQNGMPRKSRPIEVLSDSATFSAEILAHRRFGRDGASHPALAGIGLPDEQSSALQPVHHAGHVGFVAAEHQGPVRRRRAAARCRAGTACVRPRIRCGTTAGSSSYRPGDADPPAGLRPLRRRQGCRRAACSGAGRELGARGITANACCPALCGPTHSRLRGGPGRLRRSSSRPRWAVSANPTTSQAWSTS